MNTLVVYDTVFGNTEKIAQAIAAALQAPALPVDDVPPERLAGLDAVVVGSPTRSFRPTEGTMKLLKALPRNHLAGVQVAAFDTRIALETINTRILRFVVNTGGYAASTILKALENAGGRRLAGPEGFFVTGEEGPLKDGELDRAAAWAEQIDRHIPMDPIANERR